MKTSSAIILIVILIVIPSKALRINCDFTYIENCVSHCYSCTVQKVVITKPNQTVTKINGENFQDMSSVTTLRIIDQILNYVPSQLSYHFPQIENLKIWSSSLIELSQTDLSQFVHLTDLSVSGNSLETLNSNLFDYNIRLRRIDFTRNRLKHVGFNLLRPLNELVFADFYQNDCISDGFFKTSNKISLEVLKTNLREKCAPTERMMLDEIDSLNKKVDTLKDETEDLKNKINIQKNKLKFCQEDYDSFVKKDANFPGEVDWNEAWQQF